MTSDSKIIFLLLPTGMTIRNFLTTRIVENILEKSSHKIICCLRNPEKYQNYYTHPRLEYIAFHEKKTANLSNLFLLILRRRFYSINQNPTLKILEKGPLFLNLKQKLTSLLKYPFPKSKKLYGFIKALNHWTYKYNKKIQEQFSEFKPDIVFATHLVAKDEYDYLMIAQAKHVPTIGMVKSFDNLTSKGYLPFETDQVIVWNSIMEKEILSLYNYDEENIHVTGVPQFDLYKEPPKKSKDEFFKKNGLDKQKKVILYATNHEDISPDDPKNIQFIAKKLKQYNAQLIVRLHQMDRLDRYQSSPYDDVHFQVPGINQGKDSNERVAERKFLEELRDTIFYSDLTINTASTMSLDAVTMDKPVINIAFDFFDKPYHQSVKRYYDFVHYQPIIESSATSIATTKIELLKYIEIYLSNAAIKKQEREIMREIMLHGHKGNAAMNVADTLLYSLEKNR